MRSEQTADHSIPEEPPGVNRQQTPDNSPDQSLSLVIPLYNESENVEVLVARIHESLQTYTAHWELILVDDGSSDATLAKMQHAAEHYGEHVRILSLQRNFGQTAAMQAGIDYARGGIIVMMDGDLQNDPKDIQRMVDRLVAEDLDLVAGWRRDRKDNLWMRKIPSQMANRLIGRITGVTLHDYGCSLKVFRADVLKCVRLYGEMHRFIPAWLASQTSPARIKEEVVAHHARQFGESKYGISRVYRVLLDLLSVYFFMRFRARPGHFFGRIGLLFGFVGTVAMLYLGWVKFALGEDIGTRPLLLVGILCLIMSVQFFTTGVLSELMARTYFESGISKSYVVRLRSSVNVEGTTGWKEPALESPSDHFKT
jgi:glycosyltransferase involved in cell wall biosynthesis